MTVVVVCQCLEIAIHRRFQTTVQTTTATKVVEHTIDVGATLEVTSITSISPFCSIAGIDIIRKEVKSYETVAIAAHRTERTTLRHALPVLDNPLGLFVHIVLGLIFLAHSIVVFVKLYHNVGIASSISNTRRETTLMEGVHTIEFRHTHHLVQVLVVHCRKGLVACSVGFQDVGTCVATGPSTVVHHITAAKAVDGVVHNAVGHLTAKAGDNGLHSQLTHALQHILAELLLTSVPPVGVTLHEHTCAL